MVITVFSSAHVPGHLFGVDQVKHLFLRHQAIAQFFELPYISLHFCFPSSRAYFLLFMRSLLIMNSL